LTWSTRRLSLIFASERDSVSTKDLHYGRLEFESF
jgi:hypothetical protein